MDKINEVLKKIDDLVDDIQDLEERDAIEVINKIKEKIYNISPLNSEPVDCVRWIESDKVIANDYNPNKVAPPEMKLLERSIEQDGYTQPIVAYYDKKQDKYIIVDGFHRHRVGKESNVIKNRVKGYLPVVVIDKPLKDRIASTIRHNRARGTHEILPMAEIVQKLYFSGMSDKKIMQELGMEKDELLRLKQFTGLGALFAGREYSKAWE